MTYVADLVALRVLLRPNKEQFVTKDVVTIESLELNVIIPETDLQITLPHGTRGSDITAGMTYAVGADGK